MKFKIAAVAAALVLAGCAGNRCVGEFDYQKAQNLPPLNPAEGVKTPESGSALRIPGQPKNPVAYAEHVPNPEKPGKSKVMCLDAPPAMPEPLPTAPATPAKP